MDTGNFSGDKGSEWGNDDDDSNYDEDDNPLSIPENSRFVHVDKYDLGTWMNKVGWFLAKI